MIKADSARFRMGSKASGMAAAFFIALMATSAHADMQSGAVQLGGMKLPADIQYKGLPGAPQIATIFGDPTKPGIFVQRVKFPAGIKVMPHFHPDEPRTIAVLSGTLYFGLGDTFDENKLQAFPTGTFFTEAPKVSHFVWAKDGDVIVQLTSVGPTANMPVKTVAKE
jgi:quercetin dioxygenase-like cupin family protein